MENKNESINEYSKALKQAIKAFSFLGGIGIYLVVFVGICGFIGNMIHYIDYFVNTISITFWRNEICVRLRRTKRIRLSLPLR